MATPHLDLIGRYKIVGKIGQGGTSHVWKGFDASLNRYVAVKTISADLSDDPTLKKRFEREAQSAARLNHPHIVTVFDFGQEGDKLYMAMELLEGVDLKQAISSGHFRDLEAKLDAMSQICDGLAFAHAHEIVHRDLKPANVHILPDGQIKIMDFGLAKVSGSDMTKIGVVMGTPHYMSPEQVRGEKVDYRSDVFALGCVFYEIVTGKKPFDADSIHSVLYKVMQEEPKPARELVPGLPGVLQRIIEKAMAKAPAQRFAHAGEMGDFLARAQEAIAEGRGEQTLPGLTAPSAPPAPAPPPDGRKPAPESPTASAAAAVPLSQASLPSVSAPRRSERPGSGARSGTRPRSHPSVERAPSRTLWYGLGAIALVLVAAGLALFRSQSGVGDPAAEGSAAKLNLMMQDVAKKKAELARSRLEAGDYEDALEKAKDALKYDKEQAEALAVQQKAMEIRKRVEAALGAARPAPGSPTPAARAAFWELLQVAPDRKEARDFAPTYDSFMRTEAVEARRLMDAAQKAAVAARADELEDFKAAGRMKMEAEAALKEDRFATAARDFMRAHERFRRAQAVAAGGRPAPSPGP